MGRECCGEGRRGEAPTTSMERHYVPSEEMGDYEEYRKRQSLRKQGPLYPLDEEGSYGAPPKALPKPLPGYQKRERKPKVYSGYAISSDCCMHADKLAQAEDLRKSSPRTQPRRRTPSFSEPRRRAPSFSGSSMPLQSPASTRRASTLPRSNSVRGPSPAPSPDSYRSRANNWQNSLRGDSAPREDNPLPRARSARAAPSRGAERSPEPVQRPRSETPEVVERNRRSLSSDGQSSARSSTGSTDWGYTSYSSFLNGARHSSTTSSMQSPQRSSSANKTSSSVRKGKDSFREEEELYSLEVLRPAILSPWDNMGILGLSSKMYSDTSLKQSSFSFVRKESVTSYVM